jgi:uncharacterized protein (DUF927 family)
LDYTQDDFLNTTAPFEEVYAVKDAFQHERALVSMCQAAKKAGVINFKAMYMAYEKSLKQQAMTIYQGNMTEFDGQPNLDTGQWRADEGGVSRQGAWGAEEFACPHPIMPVERLVNIDTGMEKLKLAFRKGKQWRYLIVDKTILANSNKITDLAGNGIAVTSKSAGTLIEYISDIENRNYDIIPEKNSVGRLGWINDEGFSPYVDGLVFDGDANYRHIFDSIKTHGSGKLWLSAIAEIRKTSLLARIVLASSFASVLIAPLGCLPFFVHLWSGESGTGKTVALMMAASVWGDPYIGRYIQTFNSTMVGREKLAAFLNSLPMLIDELQLAKDNRGKLNFDVYALAEGVGRTRGTKTGGIDKTPTWANCTITTGETPIVNANSGSGASNRVIEIECKADDHIIEDGHGLSTILKVNYGFAGKAFIKKLKEVGFDKAKEIYAKYYKQLSESNTTEKQAMSAALIVTADALVTEWIFRDGHGLTVEEIADFLKSKAAISGPERGYQEMSEWVVQNSNKFNPSNETGEIYGFVDGKYAYIISSVFRHAAEELGYSPQALLSHMKQKKYIKTRPSGSGCTVSARINNMRPECVCMRLYEGFDDHSDDFIDIELL